MSSVRAISTRRTPEPAAPSKVSKTASTEEVGVRIAVAVQPGLFCETLCRQLAEELHFAVVGQAYSEDQIGQVLARERPQVLVFDHEGLALNAESTVRRLRRAAPATRILVLATRSCDETVERLLRANASGVIGKQLDFAVLVRAIRAVAAGEIWANRRVTSLALESLTGPSCRVPKSDLTRREQEIAEACSHGLRNKEIASQLNISTKTVKSHLNNIFRKLQVDSRIALGLQVIEGIHPKA